VVCNIHIRFNVFILIYFPATLHVPVALATNCLYSVDINRKIALDQIEGVKKYVQFESTLAFLKNPPADDSFQAPISIDPLANLTALSHDVRSKAITKEYDFELRLRNIIASANDGHFAASMGGLLSIGFTTPSSLVSVSKDGIALPEIYETTLNGAGQLTPVGSPIKQINGVDVVQYLDHLAYGTSLQSPDARFNTLFPSHGINGSLIDSSFWAHRRRYPGQDSFTFTYANGTSATFDYGATIYGNFSKVVDGPSFYQEMVLNGQVVKAPAVEAPCRSQSRKAIGQLKVGKRQDHFMGQARVVENQNALPAVIEDDGGMFAGYFLDDNTAIMQLTSFEPSCNYQNTIDTVAAFLNMCRQKKTEHLIVDLTNNPGGYILLGYDIFQQLFPDTVPYSGQRMRESAGALIIGDAFKNLNESFIATATDPAYNGVAESDWVWSAELDENNEYFKSYEQFKNGVRVNGDKYTSIWRFNTTDQVLGLGITDPSLVPGLQAPFKAENIIMLTDGQCSSTCSTFSEFMVTQKQIRSVAIGGIPSTRAMANVGGVRGSEVLPYSALLEMGNAVNTLFPTNNTHELSKRKRDLPAALPIPIRASVNYLDNVRKGSTTALQFIEEGATCRMFYTAEDISSHENVWARVQDAAWGSGKGCVVGSLQGPAHY